VRYPLLGAARVTGSLTAHTGSATRTRRPSIVQPGWTHGTHIVCTQEYARGKERFARSGATANKFRVRCPQNSGGRKGNEFSPRANRSFPSDIPFVIHTGFQTKAQQEAHDSQPGQDPTQPSLHESTSRARCKFRSLFNSASSRKQALANTPLSGSKTKTSDGNHAAAMAKETLDVQIRSGPVHGKLRRLQSKAR
jgi:hypothetical protein